MNPASGVHRKSTGPAISRALATRPSGIAAAIFGACRGIGQRCGRHIRRHPPRRHTVYPDPLRRQLARQAFGETDQRAFRHGIVGVIRLAALPRSGADQDNVPCSLFAPGRVFCHPHRHLQLPRSAICRSICATAACTRPKTASRFTASVRRHCASGIRAIGTSSASHTP